MWIRLAKICCFFGDFVVAPMAFQTGVHLGKGALLRGAGVMAIGAAGPSFDMSIGQEILGGSGSAQTEQQDDR